MRTKQNNNFAHIQRGYYKVGTKFFHFRSKWEANYAVYLEWLKGKGEIQSWEFEKETFWFEEIRRGVRSYCPDFKVVEKNGNVVFHEVKGWLDPKSKTKIKRMAKYHPEVRLIIIDKSAYQDIKSKVGRMLKFYL